MAVDRLDTIEAQLVEIHKFMVLAADFMSIVGGRIKLYDEYIVEGATTKDGPSSKKKAKMIKPNRKRSVKGK
jgi:hypothetical protein